MASGRGGRGNIRSPSTGAEGAESRERARVLAVEEREVEERRAKEGPGVFGVSSGRGALAVVPLVWVRRKLIGCVQVGGGILSRPSRSPRSRRTLERISRTMQYHHRFTLYDCRLSRFHSRVCSVVRSAGSLVARLLLVRSLRFNRSSCIRPRRASPGSPTSFQTSSSHSLLRLFCFLDGPAALAASRGEEEGDQPIEPTSTSRRSSPSGSSSRPQLCSFAFLSRLVRLCFCKFPSAAESGEKPSERTEGQEEQRGVGD